MADMRRSHPADQVKTLVDLIAAEHEKLVQAYSAIAEYGEQLRKLAMDNSRRLIGHG